MAIVIFCHCFSCYFRIVLFSSCYFNVCLALFRSRFAFRVMFDCFRLLFSYCFVFLQLISSDMGHQNINFKLLSLNARGIRSSDKRKSMFNWLLKSSADICFLQETYSTPEVESEWKKQWKGETFFSHGTNHSRGVLILVKDQLDFKLQP